MSNFPVPIPTSRLKLNDVPEESASLRIIDRFALTMPLGEQTPWVFDKQDWNLISEKCTLAELRSRLFLEQRRWNHYGREPDPQTEAEIRRLIRLIREKLAV